MSESRRDFLATTSMGLLGATIGFENDYTQVPAQEPPAPPAGMPPAFGTGPGAGPEVSTTTFADAEKLVQVELTVPDRAMAAASWRQTMAALYERRTGPRKVALESTLAPYSQWNPVLPGRASGPTRDRFIRSNADPGPLPSRDEDIAYAPVRKLSRWIEQGKLTSERLTNIYLKRIEQFD
ncbi:MAG TPA: amidase, partial [Bryobacteraceae bacterium]|nr:amidase [Bryobacteraceae bacterium]